MYKYFTFLMLTAGLSLYASCNTENSNTQPTTTNNTNNVIPEKTTLKVKLGKYGCTASKYANGEVEYQARGFLTLFENGTYKYDGLEEPKEGKYTITDSGKLLFTSGYLNNGEASPVENSNKYYVTFPANNDSRWTCGFIEP